MEYTILYAKTYVELGRLVEEKLNDGWSLEGDVKVIAKGSSVINSPVPEGFYHAMVKYDEVKYDEVDIGLETTDELPELPEIENE